MELEGLFGADVQRLERRRVENSIPVFLGKERWQVWRRKDAEHPPGS